MKVGAIVIFFFYFAIAQVDAFDEVRIGGNLGLTFLTDNKYSGRGSTTTPVIWGGDVTVQLFLNNIALMGQIGVDTLKFTANIPTEGNETETYLTNDLGAIYYFLRSDWEIGVGMGLSLAQLVHASCTRPAADFIPSLPRRDCNTSTTKASFIGLAAYLPINYSVSEKWGLSFTLTTVFYHYVAFINGVQINNKTTYNGFRNNNVILLYGGALFNHTMTLGAYYRIGIATKKSEL